MAGSRRTQGPGKVQPRWYESLPEPRSWLWLWSRYQRCGCGGIRLQVGTCPACGEPLPEPTWVVVRDAHGKEHRVYEATMGAEGRYEDYTYVTMLEEEWLRPAKPDLYALIPEHRRPSARAIVVLIFWTYFETRIERLYRETAPSVPRTVMGHLLKRNPTVGRRLDDLYEVVFSTTYFADLTELGYGRVADLLRRVQTARNRFAHGHPESIDDSLVEDLVAGLDDEHEAWIAVFNRRLKEARKQTGTATP